MLPLSHCGDMELQQFPSLDMHWLLQAGDTFETDRLPAPGELGLQTQYSWEQLHCELDLPDLQSDVQLDTLWHQPGEPDTPSIAPGGLLQIQQREQLCDRLAMHCSQ